MLLNLIFIQSNKEFSDSDQKKITALAKAVFKDTHKKLGIPGVVNITFYRTGKGNGGYTQAKDWIQVTVPKGKIDFVDLESMLYHELHHIVRGYNGYKTDLTLLDTIFAEGLAADFELDNSQPERKKTHYKYTKALVKKWLPEAKKEFSSNEYNYWSWFHGKGKPKQLGYKLGKYLVDEVCKNHPQLTQKDIAKLDTKKLLQMSGMKVHK